MKTNKIIVLLSFYLFLSIYLQNVAYSQVYENNSVTKYFKDKVLLDFEFAGNDIWFSSQTGIYKTDGVNMSKYYFSPNNSDKLSNLSREKDILEIDNIITDNKTVLFCNSSKDKIFRLIDDSIVYNNLGINCEVPEYCFTESVSISNDEIWLTVRKHINNRSYYKLYSFRDNILEENVNPFEEIPLADFIFIIKGDIKYFIGITYDEDTKDFISRLIIYKGNDMKMNCVLDESNKEIKYKYLVESNRVLLLDNLGNLITLKSDSIEKIQLGFNYNAGIGINIHNRNASYWFTKNNEILYISNTDGLYLYDILNKTLIKKIVYPGIAFLEKIKFKDNKIWGIFGPIFDNNSEYRPYSLGVIDLSKN